MARSAFLPLLALALLLAGCATDETPGATPTTEFHPTVLTCGSLHEAQFKVIASAEEWATFWRANCPGEPPQVDFASSSVAVRALGGRPSTGYSVVLIAASQEAGTAYHYELHTPGAGCAEAQVITFPESVAVVPKAPGPFLSRDTTVADDCA